MRLLSTCLTIALLGLVFGRNIKNEQVKEKAETSQISGAQILENNPLPYRSQMMLKLSNNRKTPNIEHEKMIPLAENNIQEIKRPATLEEPHIRNKDAVKSKASSMFNKNNKADKESNKMVRQQQSDNDETKVNSEPLKSLIAPNIKNNVKAIAEPKVIQNVKEKEAIYTPLEQRNANEKANADTKPQGPQNVIKKEAHTAREESKIKSKVELKIEAESEPQKTSKTEHNDDLQVEELHHAKESSKDVYEKISKGIDEKISNDVDKKISKDVNEKISKAVNEKISEDVDEKSNKGIDEKISKGIDEKINKDVVEKSSKDLVEKISNDVDEKISKDVDEKSNKGIGEKISKNIDEKSSKDVDERSNKDVDEKISKTVDGKSSKDVDKRSNNDVDEKNSKDVNEKISKDVDEKNNKNADDKEYKKTLTSSEEKSDLKINDSNPEKKNLSKFKQTDYMTKAEDSLKNKDKKSERKKGDDDDDDDDENSDDEDSSDEDDE